MADPYGSVRGWAKTAILCEAQNWRCAYCATVLIYPYTGADHDAVNPDHATLDHYSPVAIGGPRSWDNELASCWTCNQGRGTMDPMAYYDLVQRHGRFAAARMGHLWEAMKRQIRSRHSPKVLADIEAQTIHAPQFGIWRGQSRTERHDADRPAQPKPQTWPPMDVIADRTPAHAGERPPPVIVTRRRPARGPTGPS